MIDYFFAEFAGCKYEKKSKNLANMSKNAANKKIMIQDSLKMVGFD